MGVLGLVKVVLYVSTSADSLELCNQWPAPVPCYVNPVCAVKSKTNCESGARQSVKYALIGIHLVLITYPCMLSNLMLDQWGEKVAAETHNGSVGESFVPLVSGLNASVIEL